MNSFRTYFYFKSGFATKNFVLFLLQILKHIPQISIDNKF